MQVTLKYVEHHDTFSTLEIMFERHVRHLAASNEILMNYTIGQFYSAATRKAHGLRVFREMPNEFMRQFTRYSSAHLMLLYLTSPSSQGVAGLTTLSISKGTVPVSFAKGKYTKNPLVDKKHIFRPAMALAKLTRLEPGFLTLFKITEETRRGYGECFSLNKSVTLDLVDATPEAAWCWPLLAKNPNIDILRLIADYRDRGWTFGDLSANPALTADLVNSLPGEAWDRDNLAFFMKHNEAAKVTLVDLLKNQIFGGDKIPTPEFMIKHMKRLGPYNVNRFLDKVRPTTKLFKKVHRVFENRLDEVFNVHRNLGAHMVPINQLMRDPKFTFADLEKYGPERTLAWKEFRNASFEHQDRLNISYFLENLGFPAVFVPSITKYM